MTDLNQHQLGDIVNGQRLEQKPNGRTHWVPLAPESPRWKRLRLGPLFAVCGTALVLVIIFSVSSNARGGAAEEPEAVQQSEVVEKVVPAAEEPAPAELELTMSQQQAVTSAESYLGTTAFSRRGLIDVLVLEGFSTEDATFAVDDISPDWNAMAAMKAAEYLATSSFSRQGLIDQLVFEGFTPAEAEHGVAAHGY